MIRERIRKYRGLMVIVLWQAAPPVAKTEAGDLRVGFAYGETQIDELFFTGGNCDTGEPAVEHRVRRHARSFGASIQGWASSKLRLGLGGNYTAADTSSLKGGQVKGVVALEWKHVGVGTGFVLDQNYALPGIYLRLGLLDGLHGLVELPDVSFPTSNTGVGRVGIAYNQGKHGGIGAFLGIPVCYVNCDYDSEGVRADLRVPIGRAFDLSVSGFKHTDGDQEFWGLGAAGTIRLR